jgi:hypothetical protein
VVLCLVLGALGGAAGVLAIDAWNDPDVDRDARPNTSQSTGLVARLPRPGAAVVLRSAPGEDALPWILRATMGEVPTQPTAARGQFCLNFELDGGHELGGGEWGGGGQCGDPRRMDPLTFGMQGPGSGINATFLYGVTSARADQIVLKLVDGERLVLAPKTSATFPGLRFFATVLPTPNRGSVEAVEALDGEGTVLVRRSA